MISQKISECLSDRTGSYLIPLLWYTGESAEQVRKEMDAIRRAGISEFIFENRGGDWFCTEPWMRLLKKSCNMPPPAGCASGCSTIRM